MNILSSLAGGLAGAIAVTLLNEAVKRFDPEAPRLDLLGMNAVSKGFNAARKHAPARKDRYKYSLAADLIGNTVFFALAGKGNNRGTLTKGGLLGLTGGLGALLTPKPLGLDADQTNRTAKTQLMTVAYYLVGGLVAGAVGKMLAKEPTVGINQRIGKYALN